MRLPGVIAVICLGLASAGTGLAQSLERQLADCSSGSFERVIQGCSGLINSSRLDRRNKAVAYTMRGSAYAARGQLDFAIDDFSNAIRRNPRNLVAFFNRGNAHFAKEDFDAAIADFSRAISLEPGHSMSYAHRGNAYLAKGEPDRAIAEYDRALELDPANTQAAANRALAYTRKGDVVGVVRNFRDVVKVFFRSLFGG